MVDLTSEMAQLWASLGPPPPGPARVIQFIGARSGEGTSTVAREFARFAAERTRRAVWLVDLDFADSGQYRAIAAEPERFGPLGAAAAASPDGSCFFTVQPPARDAEGRVVADSRYLVAHPVGGSKLWVTRFRRELLQAGQGVGVVQAPDYWNALRRNAELVVVDAPALDRAQTGPLVAPFMDFSVLVLAEGGAEAGDALALKAAIEGAGGRCAGIVFNRVSLQPPGFLKAVLR
ncbi:sugar kinase [Phenylobacterium montanum]|uniref:Sugar kinase n=1 Tax=Phenylobacterium montanum TaxID=2823693 RepID=A0A975G0W4_9CAUL|nr:sugar kinase [Caulobacter sp. S6]QUD88554.1 sugar kinase [Caulobacter sp. S6]